MVIPQPAYRLTPSCGEAVASPSVINRGSSGGSIVEQDFNNPGRRGSFFSCHLTPILLERDRDTEGEKDELTEQQRQRKRKNWGAESREGEASRELRAGIQSGRARRTGGEKQVRKRRAGRAPLLPRGSHGCSLTWPPPFAPAAGVGWSGQDTPTRQAHAARLSLLAHRRTSHRWTKSPRIRVKEGERRLPHLEPFA